MGESAYVVRGAVVAAAALLLAGCGGADAGGTRPVGGLTPGAITTSLYAADRMRLADGGRAVVVAYTGGSCDRDARAEVVESTTRVTLTVRVEVPVGACDAVGHPRDVTARLTAPLAGRTLVDGATRGEVTPYDGHVLQPTWLPAGFALLHEGPTLAGGPSTESWTRVYGERATEASTTCAPGRYALGVTTSTLAAAGPLRGFRRLPGEARVAGAPAEALESADAGALAVRWQRAPAGADAAVVVVAKGECAGTVDASLDELLRFAAALR